MIICAVIALAGGIASAVIATVGADAGPDPLGASSTAGTSPANGGDLVPAGPTPPYVEAKIVNSGTGVFTYRGPSTASRYRDGYLDGDVVKVVCQERDGQPHSDQDPAPGQPANWPVWDKLTNGRWLPDLWTDLPKIPGDTPPNNLPSC